MEADFNFESLLRFSRKQRQARRSRLRYDTRLDVWLRLDSLLALYDALKIHPDSRHMCSAVDVSLPTCFWHQYTTALHPELFERQLREFEDAGGVREAGRLLYRLEAMKWRDRTLERLCEVIFGGKLEELGDGKPSVWPDNECKKKGDGT